MENDTDQFVHDHFVPLFILGVWGLVVNLSTVTQITVLMCDSYHFIFSIPLMDSFCSLISFLIFDIGLLLLLWGQDKLICRILDTSVLSPILLGSLYLAQISYMRFVDQRKFSLTEVLSATFFGLSYIFTLNIISYCQDVHLTKIGEVCENGGKRLENDSISRLVLTLGIWIIGAHLLAVVWSCLTDNSPEKPETSTVIIPSHQNISTHQIAAMLLNASVDANENRVACKMSVPTLLTISLLTAHLLIPIVVIFSQISPSVQAVSLALNSLSISSVRPILMLYAIAKKCVKGSQTQTERVFGPKLPQLDFGDHYVDVKEDWRDFTSSPTETEV